MENIFKQITHLLLLNKIVTLQPKYPPTWSSGLRQPIYCDLRKAMSFPELRRLIRKQMLEMAKKFSFDSILAVPTGGIAWATQLAFKQDKPLIVPVEGGYKVYTKKMIVENTRESVKKSVLSTVSTIPYGFHYASRSNLEFGFIRSKAKKHGTKRQIEGVVTGTSCVVIHSEKDMSLEQLDIILKRAGILRYEVISVPIPETIASLIEYGRLLGIEDLVSTGKSSYEEYKGKQIIGALSVFNYGFSSSKEKYQKLSIQNESLLCFDDFLGYAKELCEGNTKYGFTKDDLNIMDSWSKSPETWGEDNGFPQLTPKRKIAREKVCYALDNMSSFEEIEHRIRAHAPYIGMLKTGKESFTRFGPQIVELCRSLGLNFLDLKYHDTPRTVAGAVDAAVELGAYIINVHASGGYEMLKEAKMALDKAIEVYQPKIRPKLIGVTVLTSLNLALVVHMQLPLIKRLVKGDGLRDRISKFNFARYFDFKIFKQTQTEDEVPDFFRYLDDEWTYLSKQLNLDDALIQELVHHLASICKQAGLDGIVCAALDLATMPIGLLGDDFISVTPGIKHPKLAKGGSGQKRVMTPAAAIKDGSTYLVIGSAISDPRTDEEKSQKLIVTDKRRIRANVEILDDIASVAP